MDLSDPRLGSALNARETSGSSHGILTFMRANGAKFQGEYSSSVYLSSSGGHRTCTVVRDVTERVNREQAILVQNDFIRQIFDASLAHIAVVDPTGQILDVNKAWRDFAKANGGGDEIHWGVGANYFKGGVGMRTNPDAQATFEGIRQVQGGQRPSFEHEYRCDSPAERRWFRLQVLPLRERPGVVLVSHHDDTPRKLAELAVKEKEYFLSQSQNYGHIGSYDYDIARGQWSSTEVLTEIFGIDDAYPRTVESWLNHILPEDQTGMLHHLQVDVIVKRRPFDHIYRIVRANDRQVRWVHGLGKLELDEYGNPGHLIGVIRDITEEHELKLSLLRSTSTLESLVNLLPGSIVFETSERTIGFVNPAFSAMFATPPPEVIIGRPCPPGIERASLLFADPAGFVRQLEGHVLAKVPVLNEELLMRDGRVLMRDYLPVHQSGQFFRHLWHYREVTAQRALERSQWLQSAALGAAANAVVITDSAGLVEWANPAFSNLSGWTLEESLGRRISELVKSDQQGPEFYQAMWDSLLDGKVWQGELVNRRKDGALRTERMTITPLRDATGQTSHYIAIKEDITEFKSIQEQLTHAQRMESIGTLAGGVAHDLNNILAPVMLITGSLLERQSKPQDQELLQMVLDATKRGADVVRQLLAFSRGVQGKRAPMQSRHLLQEVRRLIEETFPREITLRHHIPADLWPVVSDPTQLHQVLLNLCVNARDAMPAGGLLTIGARNAELAEGDPLLPPQGVPGRYVELSVADSGQGIPADIRQRIFDPFFTTKELGKGTGLGLSTVMGIVRSHGGWVGVESEPGHGALFRVYLPATATDLGQSTPPEDGAAQEGHGRLILLVDDEPSVRTAMGYALESAGYRVLPARDGQEAIELWLGRQEDVSLVLTDLMMPRMNGTALIRALRMYGSPVPILVSTGLGKSEDMEELTKLQVGTILPKPCTGADLLSAIRAQLAPTTVRRG